MMLEFTFENHAFLMDNYVLHYLDLENQATIKFLMNILCRRTKTARVSDVSYDILKKAIII